MNTQFKIKTMINTFSSNFQFLRQKYFKIRTQMNLELVISTLENFSRDQ